MTQQEQDALIGQMVREVPEKKRDLVCLERKAVRIANAFRAVADYVLHATETLSDFDTKPPLLPEETELDLKKASEIVKEIYKVRAELRKLEDMKRRAGLS